MAIGFWRLALDDGRGSTTVRLARGEAEGGPEDLLDVLVDLDDVLGEGAEDMVSLLTAPSAGPVPADARVLPPVGSQEVWASGVTFERSRTARNEEATDSGDFYDRVYRADRPELFFKSTHARLRASGDPIWIRSDSTWNVPEPELALVIDAAGRIVAVTLGNDVSSRSIEGENPLYLPQAKVYEGSCALGPCLVPIADASDLNDLVIDLDVVRNDAQAFHETVSLSSMRRTCDELVDWLFRCLRFPQGVVLLTGTSIVPPSDFTLQPEDTVRITAVGLGVLNNRVEVLQAQHPVLSATARRPVVS